MSLYMKFEFNWPSGFRENDDGRTDSEVIGILIAHLGAFGLGRASDFFQDMWAEVTHGAKNLGDFF